MQPSSLSFLSATCLLTLLPSAVAHGFLSGVTIDGTAYQGNVPNNFKGEFLWSGASHQLKISAAPSPIRLIDDISPVKGANNTNLSCGQNAALAQVVADAKPGSVVSFSWMGGNNEKVHICFGKYTKL